MKKKEEKTESVIESIDFNNLFRAKGTPGVFVLRSKVNKSGMISIAEFLNYNKTKTVKAADLECLGHFAFKKNDSTSISMKEVFLNIEKYLAKGLDIEFIEMSEIVPDYDKNEFKNYHAAKVLNWYENIMERLTETV